MDDKKNEKSIKEPSPEPIEPRRLSREQATWITRLVLIVAMGSVIFLSVNSFTLFQELEEFKEGELIAKIASHEDQFVKLTNWEIVNIAKENEVSPHNKLKMNVDLVNKWKHNAILEAVIEIKQSDEIIDSFDSTFSLSPNDKRLIEFPFFLKHEGTQDIKINFLFRNDSNNEVYEHRVREVPNIEVISFGDKLLQKQNDILLQSQFGTIAVTAILVGVTIFYAYQSKRTVDVLKHSTDLTIRPFVKFSIVEFAWNQIAFQISNVGNGPATNVEAEFRINDEEITYWNTALLPANSKERFMLEIENKIQTSPEFFKNNQATINAKVKFRNMISESFSHEEIINVTDLVTKDSKHRLLESNEPLDKIAKLLDRIQSDISDIGRGISGISRR